MNPILSKTCPGRGPSNARICVIGEAPGKTEINHAPPMPFVGAAGYKLRQWMENAHIDPESVRYENLVELLPPKALSKPASYDLAQFGANALFNAVVSLREKLAKMPDAVVFVPLGNYALFALTGLGRVMPALRHMCTDAKVFQHTSETRDLANASAEIGISKLRGSVFEFAGRKVIPSIHPAAVLRSGHTRNPEMACVADWRFIAGESTFPHISERKLKIWPMREFRELRFANKMRPLAIDIETWSGDIDCVGVAWSPGNAVVIPTATTDEKRENIPLIGEICESGHAKVLQNGLFDAYWLKRRWGVTLNNWKWDTLGMHHALDPVAEHSLNYLASIYTFPRLNYWKDEAKDAAELKKHAKTREKVFVYNAKDTTATLEIFERLHDTLKRENMLDFYLLHYAALWEPLLGMMLEGFPVNTVEQTRLARERREQCEKIRQRLNAYAGCELYAKTDFSPKALRAFFTMLGIRPYMRQGSDTIDAKALKYMAVRQPELCGPVMGLLLKHRKLAKEIEKLSGTWHIDGRIRTTYTPNTEAGRLASKSAPDGKGMNIQNVKR